jgi:hypothetical protein
MSATILTAKPPLTDMQVACVDLLKEALAAALDGKVNSAAIILCMNDGYASVMAGKQAAELNLGADSLKRKIIDAVENDGNRAKKVEKRTILHASPKWSA